VALDLFVIDDGVPMPDDPARLSFVGNLDMQEHRSLAQLWTCCGDLLPYFEDSRLVAAQVLILRDCLMENVETGGGPNTLVLRVAALLDIAVEQGKGIAAFAD